MGAGRFVAPVLMFLLGMLVITQMIMTITQGMPSTELIPDTLSTELGTDIITIMVIAFSHEVFAPRDAASGLPTGKRQHEPLRITKEIDKSTPLLMEALTSGEKLTTFQLQFWQPSKTGEEQQHYTSPQEIPECRR